ncbi:MAG: serine hydrolase domain-containing protein [Acidobacteriota bacterium]
MLRRPTLQWTAAALLSLTAPSSANDKAPPADLDSLVTSGFAKLETEWQVPGGVVAVFREGQLTYAAAHGVARRTTGEPVDFETTSFRLASLSKPVTAIAALRLVERGELDLHAPVHDDYPSLHLDPRLTLAHLLTHTGGFEDKFLRRLQRDPANLPDLRSYLEQDMPRASYPPGTVSIYSNHGMALAGLVVADAVDRSFPEAAEALVFEPLGMSRATFDWSHATQVATGYRFGAPSPTHGIKTVPSSMLSATGADMVRLLEALLRPEEHDFLDPSTVELMFARHFEHHPDFTGRAFGWSEDSSVRPRRLLHSGGTDGFSSALVVVPERAAGVFVAVNGNAYVWDLVRQILDRVAPAIATRDKATSRPDVDASRLAGLYVPAGLPTDTLDAARQLFEQTSVVHDSKDRLLFRNRTYAPHENDFATDDGRLLAANTQGTGRVLLFEEGEAWAKLPWHADRRLHLTGLAVLFAATLLATVGLFRIDGPGARLVSAAAALQLLQVLGLAGFIAVTLANDGGVLRFEVPIALRALLYGPFVTTALAALGAAKGIQRHDRRVVLAATLPLLWALWLHHWNLLGVHV